MSAEADRHPPPQTADIPAFLRAAAYAVDGVDLIVESAPRGVTLKQLIDDADALTATVDAYHHYHLDTFGPNTRRDISALWLLQDVSWLHAIMAVGLIPSAQTSLVPAPTAIGMHFPRDLVFSVEANAREFDVQAVSAGSLGGTEGLYAGGRRTLTALLAPFIEAMSGHLRAGPRTGWACVTDMATAVLTTAAFRVGGESRAETELRSFTSTEPAQDDNLLPGLVMRQSPSGPIRRRHGCCLLYAIDGMDVCFSCPRLPDR